MKGCKHAPQPAGPTTLLTLIEDGYDANAEPETLGACTFCGLTITGSYDAGLKWGKVPTTGSGMGDYICPSNKSGHLDNGGGWHSWPKPKAAPIYLPGDKVVRTQSYGGGINAHDGLGETGTFQSYASDGVSAWVINSHGTTASWHLDKFEHAPKPEPTITLEQFGKPGSGKTYTIKKTSMDTMVNTMLTKMKADISKQVFGDLHGRGAKPAAPINPFTGPVKATPKPAPHMTHHDKWYDAWQAACCFVLKGYGPTEWYTRVDQDVASDRYIFTAISSISGEVLRTVKVTAQVWCSITEQDKMFQTLTQAMSV